MRASFAPLLLIPMALGCGGESGGSTAPVITVSSVSITGANAGLVVGQSVKLTATALDSRNVVIPAAGSVTWTSSTQQVASVDVTGNVTALAAGQTLISARIGGVTGSTTLVVTGTTISTLPQAFVPNQVTIAVGSTVIFVFGGGIPHNVIFDRTVGGAPPDIQIARDVSNSRTFGTRGAFKFDCTVHPGMRGQVDVQ